jgi:vitamin B12 transporter
VSSRFSVYGRVDNVFDEQYQTVAGYGTPGVAAYAGLRVRFD